MRNKTEILLNQRSSFLGGKQVHFVPVGYETREYKLVGLNDWRQTVCMKLKSEFCHRGQQTKRSSFWTEVRLVDMPRVSLRCLTDAIKLWVLSLNIIKVSLSSSEANWASSWRSLCSTRSIGVVVFYGTLSRLLWAQPANWRHNLNGYLLR